MIDRRSGLKHLMVGAAQAQTLVAETDETDMALGHKRDTTQVDAKHYATHTPEQKCKNRAFWLGAATDANAGCAMVSRHQIAANSWCVTSKKIG